MQSNSKLAYKVCDLKVSYTSFPISVNIKIVVDEFSSITNMPTQHHPCSLQVYINWAPPVGNCWSSCIRSYQKGQFEDYM